jgi:hypothetical protein
MEFGRIFLLFGAFLVSMKFCYSKRVSIASLGVLIELASDQLHVVGQQESASSSTRGMLNCSLSSPSVCSRAVPSPGEAFFSTFRQCTN